MNLLREVLRTHTIWDKTVVLMLLLSLTLAYTQYFTTLPRHYANDVLGHVSYVKSIAVDGVIPEPTGWQSQQPPLYYIVAAGLFKVGVWVGLNSPLKASRLLSLFLYTGFLFLSLATLRLYLKEAYLVIASSIVLFWPDGFTYAGRISNDLGVLFTHTLTFYLAARWDCSRDPRFLHYAFYSAFLGLLIKSSAIIGIGAVLALTIYALYKKQISIHQVINRRVCFFALSCIALNFGRIAYYRWVKEMDVKWFINLNLEDVANRLAENTPYNYFYFDIPSFIRDPFLFSLPHGGDFFWNAFLKTLLLGEWFWRAGPVAAGVISSLLLMLLLYVITFLLGKKPAQESDICPPALTLMICMLGALIAARIQVPWSSQCNGRYVYGIVVIFALYFAKSLQWHHQSGRTKLLYFGGIVNVAFCVTSIIMIICEFYPRL